MIITYPKTRETGVARNFGARQGSKLFSRSLDYSRPVKVYALNAIAKNHQICKCLPLELKFEER
ncbi:MAG: hypothetical protein C5B47_00115 [Verrucomicrobia bacterium]|nr:MAG: hypothetical protein C5B47_00115 [Verrucomicrobiota bacterium]